MYKSEDVKVHHYSTKWWHGLTTMQLTWHVPNEDEINFVLQIFREFVEPILDTLHGLLEPGQ